MTLGHNCPRAPVAVFAFNRVDTLGKCLAALERCDDFQGREVVIFCDGARVNVVADTDAVQAVRMLSAEWAARFGAKVICSDENRGLRRSILFGVEQLVSKHGTVIVLEDDIVASPRFLRFMDLSLWKFADSSDLWQVSGWFPPTGSGSMRSGFLRVPGCWGWATWKRAWSEYCDDSGSLLSRIKPLEYEAFNLGGCYDYLGALARNASGLQNTWHVRWYASMFLQRKLTLYPARSLTRNIGFDSRGTNCGRDPSAKVLIKQHLSGKLPVLPDSTLPLQESPELLIAFQEFLVWQARVWQTPSLSVRIRNKVRRILGL